LNGFEAESYFCRDRTAGPDGQLCPWRQVEVPATKNPFRQADGSLITAVPIPIYSNYTPEEAASFGIDYDQPLFGATLVAHIDGNYDGGYYAGNADVAY